MVEVLEHKFNPELKRHLNDVLLFSSERERVIIVPSRGHESHLRTYLVSLAAHNPGIDYDISFLTERMVVAHLNYSK